jgi:hypothetical protein
MTRLTLDAATCGKLGDVTACVELCDESGRTLGYFTPADRLDYAGVHPPIGDEELDQRQQETGGRSLREILRDLQNQG